MTGRARARINGMGSYLPERVLSNQDLEAMVDTSDEWITTRTGIKERRIAADHEATSDMGAHAAEKALQEASQTADSVDLIIAATVTPDYIAPSTAAIIQAKIGAKNAAAFDVMAACSGYLYGISIAKAYVEAGIYKNVLVIATEKMSAFVDYTDRNTCVLFGDGASAAFVSAEGAGFLVEEITLGADGTCADLIKIPAGGSRSPASLQTIQNKEHYWKMSGKEVFKHAVRRMTNAARECLKRAGIDEEKVRWMVPHQANYRIIDAIAKSFGISMDRVYLTLHKYGNSSAPSVAVALDELNDESKVEEGEHLLLVAFGAGLTWGAAALTKVSK